MSTCDAINSVIDFYHYTDKTTILLCKTTHTQMTQNHTHPQIACGECFHSFSVGEINHKENKHAGKKLAEKRQTKNVSNIDFARFSAYVAGSRHAWHGGGKLYTGQTVVLKASDAKPVVDSKHQLQPGPADLHLLVGS
jgi:hypothetical protein